MNGIRRFWNELVRFSDWLDDSLLGAVIGAVIIGGWMIAVPVFLPLIFEVFL
jgi:hypothetical protein